MYLCILCAVGILASAALDMIKPIILLSMAQTILKTVTNIKMKNTTTRFYVDHSATLDYDSTVPCVIGTFSGYQTSEEFRSVLNIAYEFMAEKVKVHGKMMWLVDMRQASVATDDDLKWAAEDFTPRCFNAGIKYAAFVMPEDPFAEMSINDYEEYQDRMIIGKFGDIESPKKWFKEITT